MPQFEPRAIAFLDVLGFKDLVREAERQPSANTELNGLIAVLDTHVRYDGDTYTGTVPDAAKPKHIFISDSIIVSAPVKTNHIDGLGSVIVKAIQISHKLLEGGHLLRGGIAVGSCWHGPTNIFGSGYIAAYNAEQTAGGPRIVLDESAAAHWRSHAVLPQTTMCINDGGELIVDALHPRYISNRETYGREEQAYDSYDVWINHRLSSLPQDGAAWRKWSWMRDQLPLARRRHGIGV